MKKAKRKNPERNGIMYAEGFPSKLKKARNDKSKLETTCVWGGGSPAGPPAAVSPDYLR